MHEDTYEVLLSNACTPQMVRESIRARHQFLVGQLFIPELQCDRIRRRSRLTVDLSRYGSLRIIPVGCVPIVIELRAFGFSEYRKCMDRQISVFRQLAAQLFEVSDHAADGCGVQQIGVVFEFEEKAAVFGFQSELQIDARTGNRKRDSSRDQFRTEIRGDGLSGDYD
ncbi:hypothetical protein PQR75_02810 [Paraburkholderia fungorum]